MQEEFSYQMQVNELSRKTRNSENKTREFIKVYRRLLKDKIKEGYLVEVLGIAELFPSIRKRVSHVNENEYRYEEQLRDLVNELGESKYEVNNLLKNYLKMLVLKLEMGYVVKISGLFSIKPVEYINGGYGYDTRLSPTVERPEKLTLKIDHIYKGLEEVDIPEEDIIIRVLLDEHLKNPNTIRVLDEGKIKINFISDDVLG